MKKSTLPFLCFLIAVKAFSQQEITVDLSEPTIKNYEITSGSVKLILINTLPLSDYKYKVETTITSTVIPPISFDLVNGTQSSTGTSKLTNTSICPGGRALLTNIGTLLTAKSELELRQNFDKIYKDVAALPVECQDEANPLIEAENDKRKQISYITDLEENQKVTIKISRTGTGSTTPDKIWKFSMTTESRMEKWLIHYGFTYQPSILIKNDQYFAKADPTVANSYTITKMNGHPEREWENTSPSIMLTHPFGSHYSNFMTGFTILAGTNFSTYNAGIGISEIIGYNGLITIGTMYTQKYSLNGQYKEGDIVKDNLTFDQLHTKRGGIEFFISIGVRFDKNPFKGDSTKPKASTP